MIVKVTCPSDGKLSPVHVSNGKDLDIELETVSSEVIQALKGDRKGYFEATNDNNNLVIGKRVSAQPW